MDNSPILNILTKGLPGAVTHPLYLEYNSRKREVDNVMAKYENYKILQDYSSTIDAIMLILYFPLSKLHSKLFLFIKDIFGGINDI